MPISPGTRFEQYEILSPLGKGGMGEVYLARDAKLGRKVALKVLPADFTQSQERLRRFEHEAQATSALNHPNIITIHEIGAAQGIHFITTEFIAGETLRARLQQPLPLDAVLDIALAAAHEAGIIHRDIKPENVMLRNDGIVKVLDFGLAKLTEVRKADFGRRNEEAETLGIAECGVRNEDADTLVQDPPHNPQSAIPNPQSAFDRGWYGDGDGRLYVARTGAGAKNGCAHRSLFTRRGAVRNAGGQASICRREYD